MRITVGGEESTRASGEVCGGRVAGRDGGRIGVVSASEAEPPTPPRVVAVVTTVVACGVLALVARVTLAASGGGVFARV